jgi:hypothetical protein
MSDELLARAARALREVHDGASEHAGATGDRIVARARRRARVGRSVVAFAAALAAVLLLATAWAATTGRLREVTAWVSGGASSKPVGASPATSVASAPPPAADSLPVRAVAGEVPPAPTSPAASAPPAASPAHAPARPGSAPSTLASALASPETSAGAQDAEQDAYAIAHRAHFVARDPAEALKGWDAYLKAFPAGRFALEAQYNRALTLIRLGRIDEAKAALAPFASGEAGGYRQREAQELTGALDGQ